MNKKICLIYQPCGLGDILFIQKICRIWRRKGFDIILPVVFQYQWLNDYIQDVWFVSWRDQDKKLTHKDKLPENVMFPYKQKYDPYSKDIYTQDFVFLNFFKPPIGRVMQYKYKSINIEYDDWARYLKFNRKEEKQKKLYYEILGLKDGQEYVFVNKKYQMRPTVLSYNNISSDPKDYNNKKVIQMSIFPGFTVFDWCKVLQNASQIHMIQTSLNYIMQSDQLKNKLTDKLFLYSRINNFFQVDYLFKLKWNYVKI